jgi:hypothetical protein
MKSRILSLAVLGAFTLASVSAVAAPVKLTKNQMDLVVAGSDYCYPPPVLTKGNNGWGNGTDGTNPGSFQGGTLASKSTNLSQPLAGKINTNPTSSDGR